MSGDHNKVNTMTTTKPRLYKDLRLALCTLYSNNISDNGHHHRESHEFLMNFQGRNVRRKLHSIQQSLRDAANKKATTTASRSNNSSSEGGGDGDDDECLIDDDNDDGGSTWLACLAVLFSCTATASISSSSTSTSSCSTSEMIFCSQTMLHRMRRLKLVEAIDVELELSSMQEYCQYISVTMRRPKLAILLQGILQQQQPTTLNDENEHITKGQCMLITIAWIMLEQQQQQQAQQHFDDHALQTTLAATMAVIALRLRFTPKSLAQQSSVMLEPTMCDMIVGSIHHVIQHQMDDTIGTNNSIISSMMIVVLGAVPDTILGIPGGARGRLSVDPRCIHAAKEELIQTGISHLYKVLLLQNLPSNQQQHQHSLTTNNNNIHKNHHVHTIILRACEQWAKYLPLPVEFIRHTVPLAKEYLLSNTLVSSLSQQRAAALAYVIAIYESGSWTVERILALSLGLTSSDQLPQQAKKKQSSKSKKRHKERLEDGTTDTLHQKALDECRHRGDMCIETTYIIWDALEGVVTTSLQEHDAEGEGPVVCLTACANTCLPHWIKYCGSGSRPNDMSWMLLIMNTFQSVCSHPNRNVRGLTYEPLMTLHQALLETSSNDGKNMLTEMESFVADHFYKCCLRLATGCGYPTDYFQSLTLDNDDELENERDDVRGVLRALSGSGEDTYAKPPLATTQILHQLMRACSDEISKHSAGLPPETVVHALSALAKPFNHLAEAYVRNEAPPTAPETLATALTALRFAADRMNSQFASLSVAESIAVSRLIALATSSYAPGFSLIYQKGSIMPDATETDRELFALLEGTLRSTMKTAFLSVVHVPELVAESTLHQTQFDIRGAMRGLGGEDHVGILVFMRLTDESDDMAKLITRIGFDEQSSMLIDLCKLHDQLKEKENQRNPGIFHGLGVTPKSRRILLSTIAKLVRLSDSHDRDHAQHMLHSLLLTAVSEIVGTKSRLNSPDTLTMYKLAEATFDLAAFGAETISSLFAPLRGEADDQTRRDCIHVLVEMGSYGYKVKVTTVNQETSDMLIQWGRCRAALSCLMKTMALPDLSPLGSEVVTAWITAECEAISTQSNAGPSMSTCVFVEGIICEDMLQAGAFVKNLGNILDRSHDSSSSPISPVQLPNVVHVLQQICSPVLCTLLHECPEWSHANAIDPRNCLCEAWFLTMDALVSILPRLDPSLHGVVGQLLADTCSASTLLMLYPNLNEHQNNPGMSMDGYHTLVMLDVLKACYSLGIDMLHIVAIQVANQIVVEHDDELSTTLNGIGIGIIGASLFRATSGGLPPWAVDHIPQAFEGLFVAHKCNIAAFSIFLQTSMAVRRATSRELLAGRFIDAMSVSVKSMFIESSLEEISTGNWRRFKVIFKKACGGKKKLSGFNLKPSPTNWECDRV